MTLEGSLADFTIAEVIQLLSIGKKTGLLLFKSAEFEGQIAFKNGQVYFASSSSESGTLAERLIRERKISSKHYRQALGLKKITRDTEKSKTIVDILIEEKYISEKELETAVKSLVIDAIFDVSLHRECQFYFDSGKEIQDEFARYLMDAEEIAAELVRREKTWEAIRKKIDSLDVIYVMEPEAADRAAEIRLRPVEWKVLCMLSGEVTAAEIGRKLKMSEYKLGKILYGLLTAGLIKVQSEESYVANEYFSEEEVTK